MNDAASISPGAATHNEIAARPSCHEAATANADETPDNEVSTLPDDSSKASAADCCKHGKCSCACVHATATLPGIARMEATVFHGPITRPIDVRHAAPVLSLLSRPPIV
jgi:hypothetical protein